MSSTIAYTCLLGLFMPLLLLYFNKGYLTANRYLAAFFFFSSLYVLENFYFFYGTSLYKIAFFTNVHTFFYLIGPFAFFYVRSILRDNSKLSKTDYLHFALFVISFIGYVPYFFSSWDHKLLVAQNLYSENWDISPFHLNKILLHEVDQVLNVLHTYVYSFSLWYLLWHYKNSTKRSIIQTKQYKLVRNWLLIFAAFLTIITINFTLAMASIWLYDDKSVFLNNASVALLFASLVYLGMNLVILFFPHIMYGLPLKLSKSLLVKPIEKSPRSFDNADAGHIDESQRPADKKELQLFTDDYIKNIVTSLKSLKEKKVYLDAQCKLSQISNEYGIPSHHLTYYFNDIEKISFTDWRNTLRIEHAISLINNGETKVFTLENLSLKCGFASQNTFIRAFKKANGITPSAYLKLND
jgi:AraC-like DNA-binding protein